MMGVTDLANLLQYRTTEKMGWGKERQMEVDV
jgi:hypothetical protein